MQATQRFSIAIQRAFSFIFSKSILDAFFNYSKYR